MGLLTGLLERRSSPYTEAFVNGDPLPNAWGFDGEPAVADNGAALGLPAVFACTKVLAETISTLPRHVYRRRADGGREVWDAHPLAPILATAPNPEMTGVEYWETVVGHVCTWGNGYSEIERDRGDRPLALWPLRPDRTEPYRDARGNLGYRSRLATGQYRTWPARDILHVRTLGGNGLVGYSPVGLHRLTVEFGLHARRFGNSFFSNGTRLSGLLKVAGKLDAEGARRLRDRFEAGHRGSANAFRVAVIEDGVDWVSVGVNPEDAQWVEAQGLNRADIASLYRVPLHLIQDLTRSTNNNIEQQSLEFVQYTILPWLVRIEQGVQVKLLDGPPQGAYLKHVVEGLLRGDAESRARALAVQWEHGNLSADEWRAIEDRNPLPDGQGARYFVPMNYVPSDRVDELVDKQAVAAAPVSTSRALPLRVADPHPGDVEARGGSAGGRRRIARRHRGLFLDALGRLVKREVAEVGQAAERFLGRRSTPDFERWAETYYAEWPATMRQRLQPLYEAYMDAIGEDAAAEAGAAFAGDDVFRAFVADYTAAMAKAWAGRSLGQLQSVARGAAADGLDPLEAITQRLNEWVDRRAEKVTEIETVRASGAATTQAWKRSGVTKVEWSAGGATCPYCTSLDGTVVGIEEPFLRDGEDFQPEGAAEPLKPSGSIHHPPAHSACNCGLAVGA